MASYHMYRRWYGALSVMEVSPLLLTSFLIDKGMIVGFCSYCEYTLPQVIISRGIDAIWH